MESTSESSQPEKPSARGPLHEERSLSVDSATVDNDASINAFDVLCGRGKTSFNHVGNKRFREMISASLSSYMKADNRFQKSIIVHTIVDEIQSKGGRFLKKDGATGKWVELPEQQAKDKVGHAIRDAVNSFEARRARESKMSQLKDPPRHSPSAFDQTHQIPAASSVSLGVQHGQYPRSEQVNLLDALASNAPIQHLSYSGTTSFGVPGAAALMEYHHHHQHSHGVEQLQIQAQQPQHIQTQQLPHYHPMQQQYAGHFQQQLLPHQQPPQQQLGHFHQSRTEPQGQQEKEKHEHHFLQHIDEVLGPLPPNAKDPMEPFLDEHEGGS